MTQNSRITRRMVVRLICVAVVAGILVGAWLTTTVVYVGRWLMAGLT